MSVVAIINRKGGSGKSTLATHLAAHCSHAGSRVLLGDADPQHSSLAWLQRRAKQELARGAPIAGQAVSNMVGNLAGMICDGAKVGCAMKTMTGVDAAFRAASLALAGIGIPATDGIVGKDGESSLVNLGRLAQHGMAGVDAEILRIMQDKLRRTC